MKRLPTLGSLVFLLLLSGCNAPTEPLAVKPPTINGEEIGFPADSPQLAVLSSQVVTEEHVEKIRMPARLVWDETRTVRIFAPIAGRIVKLLAQPGDNVKAGAALALLASTDIGQTQAEARRAATDLALAEKALARSATLFEHGIIAQKDFHAAQADRDRAQAERARALGNLQLYGASEQVNQEYVLRAQIGGIVVERNANPGQEIRPDQAQPGSPALFVVTDPTQLWVQIDAPESTLGKLPRGANIHLRAASLGERTLEAHIEQISDFFDPQSRTIRIRARVDNRERLLKAEMYATAEIDVELGSFIRVPAKAVFLSGSTQYLFVDEGTGQYRRLVVTAEEGGFGNMRVRTGLAPNARVVTEGGLLLMQLLRASRR